MSLIGYSCMLLPTSGPWKMAVIRAASQPLLPNSDLTQIRVLVEWCGSGSGVVAQREWVNLTNPELFKTVYVEKKLLWARRILPNEQNRAVAWPARAFTFLCGTPVLPSLDMMIVEYFCDKDKAELHLHETKELQLSEAKMALSQQAQMLQELNEWEEINVSRELLESCSVSLSGCQVSVCNVQQPLSWINGVITSHNLQTKELTLLEDQSQSLHTVNPLMVHVLFHTLPKDGHGVVPQGSQNGVWHSPPPLSLVNSPDVTSANNSASVINSPHLTSPILQECSSPHFNLHSSSKSPLPPYQSAHHDMSLHASYRRSSLQSSLMRSEPNLHRRSSLDPGSLHHLSDPYSCDFYHHDPPHSLSHSLSKIPFHSSSPTEGGVVMPHHHHHHHHHSPHGSNSQLSRHGSNPQLNSTHGSNSQLSSTHGSNSKLSHHGSNSSLNDDMGDGFNSGGFPSFPTPEDIIKQTDRSKSLGNIFSCVQTQPLAQYYQQQESPQVSVGGPGAPPTGSQVGSSPLQNSQLQKKRKNLSLFGSGLGRSGLKKPRFDVLPTIPDPQGGERAGLCANKTLSRSASQPVVFPPSRLMEKRLKQLTSRGVGACPSNGSQKPEDDLDIIHQIIETDESMSLVESGDEGSGTGGRSQSLTHIPGQFPHFAGSLPSLHHVESMHILHANYNSAPDFMQFGKPRLRSFDGTPSGGLPMAAAGAPGLAMGGGGGGGGGGVVKEGVQYRRDSQRSEFQSSTSGPYSSFTEHDDITQGVHKALDGGQSVSRRNSLYESQSAVGTPVLTNDSAQNTPQGMGGTPFDFPHPRNCGAIVSESGTSGVELRRWNGHANGMPNTYQYTASSVGEDSSSAGDLMGGRRLHREGGGAGGEKKDGNAAAATAQMFCDYVGMSSEVGGGVSKLGADEASTAKGSGAFELNMLPGSLKAVPTHPDVATEAVVLTPSLVALGVEQQEEGTMVPGLGEFSISKVVNRQFSTGEDLDAEELLYDIDSQSPETMSSSTTTPSSTKKKKPKKPKKAAAVKENSRSRGRPRLTEDEKQRRKELRELGLMKRSKRRTKEQVALWKAEKTLSPAKRGRKPGSGKKNIIKTATGKVVFVSIDLSQYPAGTVLLQNGFCRAYPGVSKCLDCGTCDGNFPSSKYCRFLEFRKLCVEENEEPRVSVHGFADYKDVNTQDLVPWTPLRTNCSGMDEGTALFILNQVISNFIEIVTEEARTLPDNDVCPIWKRAVSGVRELCDTCDTSLFNFHWVCQSCGFCICPACYNLAYSTEDKLEAVSSMEAASWPDCVSSNQPHRPSGLILAQIIPANVLADVISQAIAVCSAHKVQVSVPKVVHRLTTVLSPQIPHKKFQNEPSKKSKGQKAVTPSLASQLILGTEEYMTTPSTTPPLSQAYVPTIDMSSVEVPHSCSNGHEDHVAPPISMNCPHRWLCDGTLLCLLNSKHSENILAFQQRWKRGEPVLVTGVNQFLDKNLWTPQAFERDFGEEAADLVDCRIGLHLLQLPSRVFWAGFEDMSVRLRDPTNDEPRLLKLKDWPPGADFSEKLPRRYNDLMNALPLHEYTRREGCYNMASNLPDFFVKPDLGPKMYNAYGSPLYPSCGTTNLHLDISSAVNIMVYCGIPPTEAEKERKLVEEVVAAECCRETLCRVKETGAKVGAIWHLYSSTDTHKIRLFLRKVYEERGYRIQVGSDPIHDQLVYLDSDLRQRLYREYRVKGWAIAQCVGDAVFIPAGAPHQVRNVCSCIKIAEDFVSPEHVYECLKLTEEFRQLSERHANHEDKLQVKNIIYHSIKDAVGALKATVK